MGKLNTFILDDLTVDDYLKLRQEGLSHRMIAEKLFVGFNTLNRWIQRQKYAGALPNEKLPRVTRSKIGEKISIDVYVKLRSEGKTNYYIADVVGISRNSLYKWIKVEKELGRLG